MKILNLKIENPLLQTEQLIKEILKKDLNAFKSTRMQFIRNNQVYNPVITGMIA